MGKLVDEESEFKQFLREHEDSLKYVVKYLGCPVREDNEDLIAEGQRILWNIFKSPKRNSSKSFIKMTLRSRLIDYMRTILPLSRSHLKAIKDGRCLRPQITGLDELNYQKTNTDQDVIDDCIDATLLLSEDILPQNLKNLLKLLLNDYTEQEILRTLGISAMSLRVYRWELRQIYSAWNEKRNNSK